MLGYRLTGQVAALTTPILLLAELQAGQQRSRAPGSQLGGESRLAHLAQAGQLHKPDIGLGRECSLNLNILQTEVGNIHFFSRIQLQVLKKDNN